MKRDALLFALLLLVGFGSGLAVGLKLRVSHVEPAVQAAEAAPSPPVPSWKPRATFSTWRSVERGISSLTLKNADWFLNVAKIPDFGSELSRATPLKARDPKVEGCFGGEVKLIDGKVWKMDVEISLIDGEPLRGTVAVRLLENGKIFNNSSGSGPIRDVKNFGEPSQAFILEASEIDFFSSTRRLITPSSLEITTSDRNS